MSVEAIRKEARGNRGMGISDCGMGNREKGTGKREKEMRISDCGMRNGGRCQWSVPPTADLRPPRRAPTSVVSRVSSGDPQGSAFQLRIADGAIRAGSPPRRNRSRITNHESRTTDHESRITNHEPRITNHGPRITNHESRTTNHANLSGRTKPFARKVKAATGKDHMLPHVADGIMHSCADRLSRCGSSRPARS